MRHASVSRAGMRKAKIVCTIGPATHSPAMLDQLIAHGMNAARLNFSHGSSDSQAAAVQAVRDAAARQQAPVAIIQDLQGPRIRVGVLPADRLAVVPRQLVTLIPENTRSSRGTSGFSIPVTYSDLARDVKRGARILIDDGLIELQVVRIAGEAVECEVVTGGLIGSHKGLNLPGTRISAPTLTDKDLEDLRFGLKHHIDYVALSFVRGPEDIRAARRVMSEFGGEVPIIAKIERPEAVEHLEALLEQADGIMIARGDLGVE